MSIVQSTKSIGGYDKNFVSEPPDDLMCLICHTVAREPQQTECDCGKLFCKTCLEGLSQSYNGDKCPTCRGRIRSFSDRVSARRIKGLQVKCDNVEEGCPWQGTLGELESHAEVCEYAMVACSKGCGSRVSRRELEQHNANDCPFRMHMCPHCNEVGPYSTITSSHLKQCPQVALSCPVCTERVPRWAFEKHQLTCSSTEVNCPNCNHRTIRRDLEYHVAQVCPKRPFVCPNCKTEGEFYHITGIHQLEECSKVQIPCPNASCSAQIPRETLAAHLASCPKQQVECPFKCIGCRFLIHRGGVEAHKRDYMAQHLDMALLRIADIQKSSAARSNERQLQASIEALESEQARMSQLLENQVSKLKARIQEVVSTTQKMEEKLREVTKATAKEQQVTQLVQETAKSIGDIAVPVVPVVCKMTGFEGKKRNSEHWHSPPFYTRAGGYKMCLRVYPNGTGSGYGTHVSVSAVIMMGKNDESLIFPFCGSVTIGILNQLEDHNHATKTVLFDERNQPVANGRVVARRLSDIGMGYGQFISHAELKPKKRTAYLLDDTLYLTVVHVNVDHANKPWLTINNP